jgi:amino acid adenylation domain-containing protein
MLNDPGAHGSLIEGPLPIGEERNSAIHVLFEAQVNRTPMAEAVVSRTERVTYLALNKRANRLANLMRVRGLQPGDLVGIALPRTVDLVVGLLAVLKSGAGYVPLDPAYPAERLNFMLVDSGCRFVVTTSAIASRWQTSASVCLDRCAGECAIQSATNPGVAVRGQNLAYVIYTSGSTGKPKGVEVEHRSVSVFLHWARDCFSSTELGGLLAGTSICFDLSVFEVFAPLCWGGRVLLAESVLELPVLPYRDEAKLLNTVPSAMRELLAQDALPASVCTICLAGEVFPAALVRQLGVQGRALRVLNLYGPTEDTIYSTYVEVDLASDEAPPIGRPLPGTRAYVVDGSMKLCPVGIAGELLLGGAGLARGYLGQPELTADRFLINQINGDLTDRIYRTGDRVHLRQDGQLVYLGRLDDRVKIRGYRIELGEVERALGELEGVTECIVAAMCSPAGDAQLVAYFSGSANLERLRNRLAEVLPAHMLPSIFVKLEEVPHTPSGKKDRNQLPPPDWSKRTERALRNTDGGRSGRIVLAPASNDTAAFPDMRETSSTEAALLAFCREIIAYPTLGIDEPLLDVGFHSLAFAQLAWRIQKKFGILPTFSEMFVRRTVADLAFLVESRSVSGDGGLEPLRPTDRKGPIPLSLSQERLWFLEKLHPHNLAYHFQSILRFHGRLDIPALEKSLNILLQRHEILRTTFPQISGYPCQRIHPFAWFTLCVEEVPTAHVEQRMAKLIREPFDLEHLPPRRWFLFRLGPEEHWFLHMEHHVLHDGAEYEVFLEELFECYDALAAGCNPNLPSLTVQFADFAVWQRRQLARGHWDGQLDYWQKHLVAPSPATKLPTDRPRASNQTFAGEQIRHPFTREFYDRLLAAAANEGVTPYMWLHAAFQAFLFRYTKQTDIIVGTGVANRQSPEAHKLLGMIINTVALRISFAGEPSFREVLARARHAIVEALDNQNAPFDHVIQRLGPGTVLFNTFFDTYDGTYPSYHNDVLRVERQDVLNNGTCKFDLVALVIPGEETPATLLWEYNTDLFTKQAASRMMRHFLALLGESVANPSLPVALLPVLSLNDRKSIVAMCVGRSTSDPRRRRVDESFAAVAAAQPDAVAVICGEERLTYRELDQRADELAGQLRATGARPGAAVAFSLPRGTQALCAMLAILKCGCAYLPVDPKLPKARQDLFLQSAGALLLITGEGVSRLESSKLTSSADPLLADAAYVLFTSGSTGSPKAVSVPHRAVARLVCDVDYVHLGPDTRFLQLAPLSFDASTLEIWGPLLNGGAVVVHPAISIQTP